MIQRCESYQCYLAGECSCEYYGQQGTFFSVPAYNNNNNNNISYYESENYSSHVDCTLSLGTPSTRMMAYDEKRREEHQSSLNFGWDLPRTVKHAPSSKSTRRGDKSSANVEHQMFARHCANCGTTTTPLWRNGPSGPKSLCNACGIRYKKEERKAASSGQQGSSWLHHQKTPRYAHGIGNDINPGMAFLSWSFNDREEPEI